MKTVTLLAAILLLISCSNDSIWPERYVPLYRVELSQIRINLKPGEKFRIVPHAIPKETTFKYFEWRSGNDEVVTVENGVLTAVAPGSVYVYAKEVNSGKGAACEVTVGKIENNNNQLIE